MAADSMIGVLRTRSRPNSSTRPTVALNAPPYSAMSCPSSTHPLVLPQRHAHAVGDGVEVPHLSRTRARLRRVVVAGEQHAKAKTSASSASAVDDGSGRVEGGFDAGGDVGAQFFGDGARGSARRRGRSNFFSGSRAAHSATQFGGDVVGARRFLVTAHAERLALEQRRAFAGTAARRRPFDGVDHREHVVAVDDFAGHAVAAARDRRGPRTANCSLGRRRHAPAVVLHHEDDRQLPHRGEVERLVEVALARAAVAAERRRPRGAPRAAARPAPARRRPATIAPRWLIMPTMWSSSEPKWKVRSRPVGESVGLAEELPEQPIEVDAAGGEHAEVAVHRQDPVVGLEGVGHADGDGFLADPAEPLRQPALAQQRQHALLDQARQREARGRCRPRSVTATV